MISFNKLVIDEATCKRFFSIVPDIFQKRIEPLILKGYVPPETCVELIKNHETNPRAITEGFIAGKSVEVLEYRNNGRIVKPNFSLISDLLTPEKLGVHINLAWSLDRSYDWLPSETKPLYTVFSRGEYCRDHLDVIFDSDGNLVRKTRRLSGLLYLNSWSPVQKDNHFTGGELLFSSLTDDIGQAYSIKPTAGDVVIFPSTPRYRHSVTQVTSGERHNIVFWLRFADETN